MVGESIKVLKSIISDVDYVKLRIPKMEDRLNILEDEHVDLTHEIVLGKPKHVFQAWVIYKRLRELGLERYDLKIELEISKGMCEYIDKNMSRQDLSKILTKAKKIESKWENKIYKAKVREDLTIQDNKKIKANFTDNNKTREWIFDCPCCGKNNVQTYKYISNVKNETKSSLWKSVKCIECDRNITIRQVFRIEGDEIE